MVQPEDGPAELGLLLHQVEPRHLGRDEPRVQPLEERHRPEAWRGELGGQLLEPGRLLLQPVALLRGRRREPGQLDVRRQVTDLDDGRDARAVERRPEQLVDQQRLVRAQRLRRRRRQAEHHRVRELVEQLAQQPAPDLEQVVALVEHEQQRPGRLELLDERPAVLVEPREERARTRRGRAVVVHLLVRVEDGERLVGQRRQRRGERAVGRDVDAELAGRALPLALDRGVRAEHDGLADGARSDPVLHADQPGERLAGARRQRDPGPAYGRRPRRRRGRRAPPSGAPAA